MTDELIAETEALLAAAPDGPWLRDGMWIISPAEVELACVDGVNLNRTVYSPTADLIAASPSLLARLVEALRDEHRRAGRLAEAIETHHADIWAEWSPVSRSCPPPADVALWAHVGIDPAVVLAAAVSPEGAEHG